MSDAEDDESSGLVATSFGRPQTNGSGTFRSKIYKDEVEEEECNLWPRLRSGCVTLSLLIGVIAGAIVVSDSQAARMHMKTTRTTFTTTIATTATTSPLNSNNRVAAVGPSSVASTLMMATRTTTTTIATTATTSPYNPEDRAAAVGKFSPAGTLTKTTPAEKQGNTTMNNVLSKKQLKKIAQTRKRVEEGKRFSAWSQYTNYSGRGRPRVLIFTWCSNNSYFRYVNENYWKLCYASIHGFDVMFTDESKDVNGVKVQKATLGFAEKSYSDFYMWAWLFVVRKIFLSGAYDYVFVTGADVLIHEPNIFFPVWALDTGHHLTVMDQHLHGFGLNCNGLLFRSSSWAIQFLDDMLEHRGDFNLQGENGPYMEAILTGLGREAVARGKPGYLKICRKLLKLKHSAAYMFQKDQNLYTRANEDYSRCFFGELERMAGPYGSRKSKTIGFSPTFGPNRLPWANCWGLVRDYWQGWQKNCLTLHWNGYKDQNFYHAQGGRCPDRSLDWRASPYNPSNREAASDGRQRKR